MFYSATLHVHLECQQEGEQELVVLIQSTAGVFEHFVSQELNDVLNPLGWDRRLV